MDLKEQKEKVLSLIEEINPESTLLTDDPDISEKINYVINQIQNELCRIKKIPAKFQYNTVENSVLPLKNIPNFYQLNKISTPNYKIIGDYEIVFDENLKDEITIYYYKYPERINKDTQDTYKFELSEDLLEIMPYGVAADLLKNDMISNYGQHYATRYNELKQMIDTRNTVGIITIEGGIDI